MSLDLKGPAGLLEPIRGRDQLLEYFRGAEKPRSDFRVGVEHEKIGVVEETLAAVPYYGEAGIRTILDALARDAGGMQHQHKENGQPIAVLSNDASVTLEPGGQLELSGASTRRPPRSRATSGSSSGRARSAASVGWPPATGRSGLATKYRGCRRAVTRRCASRSVRAAGWPST